MSTDGIADWVFESVLQFLRSPLWTAPVLGFIEEHCGEFDAADEVNKVQYTFLHQRFRELVDTTLSEFLGDLGVSEQAFLDACKGGRHPELSETITEYLLSMDDFPSFRSMMERRNHELELEAMYAGARIADAAARIVATDASGGDDEMDDDERFLLEMAIKASLQPVDVRMKEAELADAELLEALALSLALEQERLLRERLAEEGGAGALEEQSEVNRRQIQEEFRRQREENAAKAAAAATAETTSPAPTPQHLSGSPAKPSVASRVLAPVGDRRGGAAPAFGVGKALPSIGSMPATAASSETSSQPSFNELVGRKQQDTAKPGSAAGGKAGQPSDEEVQQRAAYLKAQRDALLKQRQQQRECELQSMAAETSGEDASKPATAGTAAPSNQQADAAVRLAIARRFKEDLIQETRKAAGRGDN
jgi:hypothetical protein